MTGMIGSARSELVKRAATKLEPSQNAVTRGFEKFKLDGPACLLLDDDRA